MPRNVDPLLAHHPDRERAHGRRLGPRTMYIKAITCLVAKKSFGDLTATRIPRAEKEYFGLHVRRPCNLIEASASEACRTISSGFFTEICTVAPQHEDPPEQMSAGDNTSMSDLPVSIRGIDKV